MTITIDDLLIDQRLSNLLFSEAIGKPLNVGSIHDPFASTVYIDQLASLGVDYSESGVLKPVATDVEIDRTSGTIIGDMNEYGGLSAAFDGVTSKTGANSSVNSGASGWIGKTLPSAKALSRARVYGANNNGFAGGANPLVTIGIYGSNSTPSGPTDGTLLGEIELTDTADESAGRDILAIAGSYDHIWEHTIRHDASPANVNCAQLQLFENDISDMDLRSLPFAAASVPDEIHLAMLVDGDDATYSVSRDNGASWVSCGMTVHATQFDGRRLVYSGAVDVTGQTSGSQLRWRCESTGIIPRLHAAAIWAE